MVVFGLHVENQFLAYFEEEGGEPILHEEGEELEYFPEDNTKNQQQSGESETKEIELHCLDPQENPQQVVLPSKIKD